MKKETYKSQQPFAGEKKPSMLRRCVGHDYTGRQIYMITMVTERRRPLFGQVVGKSDAPAGSDDTPHIELSPLVQCEELSFVPKQTVIAGIPIEKLLPRRQSVEYLYRHDGFSPTLAGNSIYSQGFFQEITTFVNAVEGKRANVLTDLQSVEPTLKLIDEIME